jgi:hypothetical protein
MHHRKYLKPGKAAEKIDNVTVGTLANWRWKEMGPPYYRVRRVDPLCRRRNRRLDCSRSAIDGRRALPQHRGAPMTAIAVAMALGGAYRSGQWWRARCPAAAGQR